MYQKHPHLEITRGLPVKIITSDLLFEPKNQQSKFWLDAFNQYTKKIKHRLLYRLKDNAKITNQMLNLITDENCQPLLLAQILGPDLLTDLTKFIDPEEFPALANLKTFYPDHFIKGYPDDWELIFKLIFDQNTLYQETYDQLRDYFDSQLSDGYGESHFSRTNLKVNLEFIDYLQNQPQKLINNQFYLIYQKYAKSYKNQFINQFTDSNLNKSEVTLKFDELFNKPNINAILNLAF